MQYGILEHNPLYRFETVDNNWITLQQQTYETSFDISSDDATKPFVLYLDKVGTIANIYVNGFYVGYTDNIYRSYYFKIDKSILKTG